MSSYSAPEVPSVSTSESKSIFPDGINMDYYKAETIGEIHALCFHKMELKIWAGQKFGQHLLYCQITATSV